MAAPIPSDVRRKIIDLRQAGMAYGKISGLLGYPVVSIKRVWYRFGRLGEDGLLTKYRLSGRKKVYPPPVRQKASELKDGEQGAPYLRSLLFEEFEADKVPSERTVQRWLKQAGQNRPRGRPKSKGDWTDEAMHTLQIDGKSGLELKGGRKVSWVNVADEATGGNLCTVLFPLCPGRIHPRDRSLPGPQPTGFHQMGAPQAHQDRQRHPACQRQPARNPHPDTVVVDRARH